MSDLEIVAAAGGVSGERRREYSLPTPIPLLIFDHLPPPWYKFLSLLSLRCY